MEEGVALVHRLALCCRQLEYVHGVEGPAVRFGDLGQLGPRLGEGDVQPARADCGAGQQELQRQRRLAGTRFAVDEIEMTGGKTASEDLIEALDTCARARLIAWRDAARRPLGLAHTNPMRRRTDDRRAGNEERARGVLPRSAVLQPAACANSKVRSRSARQPNRERGARLVAN